MLSKLKLHAEYFWPDAPSIFNFLTLATNESKIETLASILLKIDFFPQVYDYFGDI